MNNIGWLFVFMNEFDNEFNATERPEFESSGRPQMCAARDDRSEADEVTQLRSFFELIAKWEEEESSHGS
jgi:hypothetical protein